MVLYPVWFLPLFFYKRSFGLRLYLVKHLLGLFCYVMLHFFFYQTKPKKNIIFFLFCIWLNFFCIGLIFRACFFLRKLKYFWHCFFKILLWILQQVCKNSKEFDLYFKNVLLLFFARKYYLLST